MMNNALRVFVIACATADQRGLLCVAPTFVGACQKPLGYKMIGIVINLLSGITRRESGLFAKNTWEVVMGLL